MVRFKRTCEVCGYSWRGPSEWPLRCPRRSCRSRHWHNGNYQPPNRMDRFMAKVRITPGCWLWMGGHNSLGYGLFRDGPKSQAGARRFAYQQFIGPIPEGLTVDHACRNPRCVNPDHLRLLTAADNRRDAWCYAKPITHCKRNHPFAGENLYMNKQGRRWCRACNRIRANLKYQRRKEKQGS